MGKPSLLLHVGSHKTGTTALQYALHVRRAELASAGVYYPEVASIFRSRGRGHHAVAHALARRRVKHVLPLLKFQRMIRRNSIDSTVTVLSSEAFYRHTVNSVSHRDPDVWFTAHRAYLKRVARYLAAFNVTPVLYYRQPETFAISLFKEQIMRQLSGAHVDFQTFLERKRNHFDYQRHIAELERVFGSVTVLSYEAQRKTGLVRGFFDLIGAESIGVPDGPVQLRISASNQACLWLQRHVDDDRQRYQRRVLFALRHSGDEIFKDPPGTTLWPSSDSFKAFVERHAGSYSLPFIGTPQWQDALYPHWTALRHAETDKAFEAWESAFADLLSRREKLNLTFYDPDPID